MASRALSTTNERPPTMADAEEDQATKKCKYRERDSTLVREGISFRVKVAAAKDLDVEKDLAAENEVDFDEKEIVISLKGPIPVVDFSDQLEQRPAIGKRL